MTKEEALLVFEDIRWTLCDFCSDEQYEAMYIAMETLEEKKYGHWIEVGKEEGALGIEYKILKCSNCGWESSLPIPRNFCPECGADMKGEQK